MVGYKRAFGIDALVLAKLDRPDPEPTALPLYHRSDHPILTTGAALTRRAAFKTTGRSDKIGLQARCGIHIREHVLPTESKSLRSPVPVPEERGRSTKLQSAGLPLPLSTMQPGPDFPKLEHPGTCSSTRDRGGEFCVSLRACV